MRLAAFAALAAVLLPPLPSHAGQAAGRTALGFSKDGKYFAFEQFSGIYETTEAFAEVRIIATDLGVSTSPAAVFRLEGDSEVGDRFALPALRKGAAAAAREALKALKITPAKPLAAVAEPSMPLGEEGYFLTGRKALVPSLELRLPGGRRATLKAETPALARQACGIGRDLETDVVGLKLTLAIEGAEPRTLIEDANVPSDRPCITGYGLAEAYVHMGGERPALVVLLETEDMAEGFEGSDRRFVAMGFALNAE